MEKKGGGEGEMDTYQITVIMSSFIVCNALCQCSKF